MLKHIPILLPCILLILTFTFLSRYALIRQAVYGDGIYYWAYTRSLVVDHDLNFQNEGAHQYGPEQNNVNRQERGNPNTDLAQNKYYPLGPSLVWLLPFALTHQVLEVGNWIYGSGVITNGYADAYQLVIGLVSIFVVVLGLFFIKKLLRQYYPAFSTNITLILIVLATNLFYYAGIDVLNSHPVSFFLSALFLYLFIKWESRAPASSWLILGFLLGIMTTVRLQDCLLGFIPVLFLVKKISLKKTPSTLRPLILFIFGSVVGFLPQLVISEILYHDLFLLPYTLGGHNEIHLLQNNVLQLILSPQRGLLATMPIFVIGLIGIFLLRKGLSNYRLPFLVGICAEIFLIGGWSGWSQGEAYGIRMLLSTLPIIALGVAECVDRLSHHFSKTSLILLCTVFIVQNLILIATFHLFLHNPTYIGNQMTEAGQIKMKILKRLMHEGT